MAEPIAPSASPTAPALTSTSDQVPYVPVSWLAVMAAATAGLLGLLLAIMGVIHFRARRPLLEEELLILALVAVVLGFAARRIIRNSEGTRTGILFGIDLPSAAWWGGVVLGLGYASYLLAIEFSIRKDAQTEVQTWTDFVLAGDNESLNRAFHRMQDPSQRKTIPPTDSAQLEGRWGKEYIAFRQCDLRRLIARNPDCKIELGGLRDWYYRPTGIECSYTAVLTCAEGTFPLLVPMRGVEGAAAGTDTGGRQWQIQATANGFIEKEKARLTPYGWFVGQLGATGAQASHQFLSPLSHSPDGRVAAFIDFVKKSDADRVFFRPFTVEGYLARAAAISALAGEGLTPSRGFLDRSADVLFRLPGGAEPDEARRKSFRDAWFDFGIVKAGERLRDSPDVNDTITITDSAILYRQPIEIPLNATRGDILAARGSLILECRDPAILDEVKRLKAAAVPGAGTDVPDRAITTRAIPWFVVRIESDMKPVRMEARPSASTGMPGAPPGADR